MVGVARGHQRAHTLKPYSQKTSQSNHTRTTAFSNSMKLNHAHGATQDGWVMVERSCRCQPAKSIRSREHARRGWEKKLKQEKSTTKMGSRGSDTSPRRDAVWHQLYSASHIYTEEREKDKTVNIIFVWPTHLTKSHKKSWEHGNGTLLLFLTPDNISLCVRSLHRTPGACSK